MILWCLHLRKTRTKICTESGKTKNACPRFNDVETLLLFGQEIWDNIIRSQMINEPNKHQVPCEYRATVPGCLSYSFTITYSVLHMWKACVLSHGWLYWMCVRHWCQWHLDVSRRIRHALDHLSCSKSVLFCADLLLPLVFLTFGSNSWSGSDLQSDLCTIQVQ